MFYLRPGLESVAFDLCARVMAGRLTPPAVVDECFEALLESKRCTRDELERALEAEAERLAAEIADV